MRRKKRKMTPKDVPSSARAKDDSSSSSSDICSSSEDENSSRHINPLVPTRVYPREVDELGNEMKKLSIRESSSEEESRTKIDEKLLMNSLSGRANSFIDPNDIDPNDMVLSSGNTIGLSLELEACAIPEFSNFQVVEVEPKRKEIWSGPRSVTVNNEADYLIYPKARGLIDNLPAVTEISQFVSAKKITPLARTKWENFAEEIEATLKTLVFGKPRERADYINKLVTVRQIDKSDPREGLRGQDGVFAKKEIAKGTVITHYVGAIVSDSKEAFTHDGIALRKHMCEKHCGGSEQLGRYAFDVPLSEESHLMIDAVGHGSNIGSKINDGCGSNNTEFLVVSLPGTTIPIVSVISTADIPKDTEILVDYGNLSELRINKNKSAAVDDTTYELFLKPFISWSDRFVFRQDDKKWVLFLTKEDRLKTVCAWLLDRGLKQPDIQIHPIQQDSVFEIEICLNEADMNSLRKSVEEIRQAAFQHVRDNNLGWMNQYPDLCWYSGYDENGYTPIFYINKLDTLNWFKAIADSEHLDENDLFALTKYSEFKVPFYESDKSKKYMYMPWVELLDAIYRESNGSFFSPFSIIRSQQSENLSNYGTFDVAEYILIKKKLGDHEISKDEQIIHVLMRPNHSFNKPLEVTCFDKNIRLQLANFPRNFKLAELIAYALAPQSSIIINNATYGDVDLSNTSMGHIKFISCSFRNLTLQNVDFHQQCRGLTFKGCVFSESTLRSIFESGPRKLSGNILVSYDSGKKKKIPLIDASSNASIDDYLNKLPGYCSEATDFSQSRSSEQGVPARELKQTGLFSSKPTSSSSSSHTISNLKGAIRPTRYR